MDRPVYDKKTIFLQVDVTVASLSEKELCVKCSRDVKICADTKLNEVANQKFDAVILPGGVGWKNLAAVSKFIRLI